jgi:hypothetical protein
MNRFLPLFLFLLLPFSALSQQGVVRGQVLDAVTAEPIAFANVYLEGALRGTYTSGEGYFEFRYRPSDRNKRMIVSHIGYESLKLELSTLAQEQTLSLELQPKEVELSELVVSPHKDTVRLIVEKAARNIRKNYPRQGYTMKGFYREANRQGEEYVRLVESAVTIQDKGYDTNVYSLRARVDEIRRSNDDIDLDWKSAIQNWYYEKNGIYKTIKQDPLRIKDQPQNLFEMIGSYYKQEYTEEYLNKKTIEGQGTYQFLRSPQFLQGYDFKLDTVLLYEGKPAYKIRFINNQLTEKQLMYGEGELIIQKENQAILAYTARLIRTQNGEVKGWNLLSALDKEQMLISEHRYLYRAYGSKYYLSYASVKTQGNNSSQFSRNWKKGSEAVLYQYNELLITDILNEKLKRKEIIARDEDIYDASTEYRQDFWDSYNVLIDLPTEEKIKQDLEKKKKLVKQFNDNN